MRVAGCCRFPLGGQIQFTQWAAIASSLTLTDGICTSGATLGFSILLKDTLTYGSVPPRGAGIPWTGDLLITSPPALPTEPQPPPQKENSQWKARIKSNLWRSLKLICNIPSVYLYVSLVIVVRSACPESAQLLLHPYICASFCCTAQQTSTLQAAGNSVQVLQRLLHNFFLVTSSTSSDIPKGLISMKFVSAVGEHFVVVNNLVSCRKKHS